ncbi:MAG TPA: hypothetical protein VFF40_10155 [Acidimicrobiia bacterium]|nr:hypothetical protein [Acidimicrobiia bacterium]
MDIRTTFETAGLAVTGDPPAVTVSVGSATVIVQVGEERAGLVLLRAAIAVPGRLDPEDLAAAALATPGDQRYLAQPGRLVGERRLVEPTAGRLYDAVHELAESTAALGTALTEVEPIERDLETGGPPVPIAAPVGPMPPAAARAEPATQPVSVPAPLTADQAAPAPPTAEPFWFSVDAPTDLVDSQRRVVATLQPGAWHQALRQEGDWLLATGPSGAEGWLASAAARRA